MHNILQGVFCLKNRKWAIFLIVLSCISLLMLGMPVTATDVNTQPALAAGQLPTTYKSPDGNWETPIYCMDATVNGIRKIWPMTTKLWYTDVWGDGHENETITLSYDPNYYNPYNCDTRGLPYFSLSIEEKAVQGKTYTKDDFGIMGFIVKGYEVINITNCGAFNINADPRFLLMLSSSGVCSYAEDTRDKFVEAVLRLDTLDREKGIVAGYLKFSMLNKYGEKMDVEGYFADKFKDDTDRPTKNQIYDQLHPKAAGSENTNQSVGNSIPSNTNIKLPILTNSPCPSCGGTGKITCASCYGVGYTSHMGYRYGVYGVIVDSCVMCGGAGARLCSRCGGSGIITQFTTP